MDSPRQNGERRLAESLLAVIEAILALGVAMGSTLLFTLPLVSYSAEYPLVPTDPKRPPAYEQLVERLAERGIGRGAEVEHDGENEQVRLVVSGLTLLELAASGIPALIGESGFEPAPPSYAPSPIGEVLEESGRLVFSIQALVFLLVALALTRFRVAQRGVPTAAGAGQAILLGLLGGAAAFGLSLVIGVLLSLLGLPVEEQEWAIELFGDRQQLVRLLPWIVLIVPLSEEVFFRGYVLRFLKERTGVPTAVVVSTTMFALVHFNPTGFVVYLGIGAVLAYAYLRSGSLVTPVLAHAVHNSLTLVASLMFGPPGSSAG